MSDRLTDLNALVGSRICHDLISPLGAIGNGVELLSMAGNVESPEMTLIAESVGNANAKIRFFRVAFGAASDGQSIGRSEITSILQDITASGRLNIAWSPPLELPRREVKLAFLLILCLETAMPYGGRIDANIVDGIWRLVGCTEKPRVTPDLWEVLSNPSSARPLSPAEVHFGLAPAEAEALGRKITIDIRDAMIRINA